MPDTALEVESTFFGDTEVVDSHTHDYLTLDKRGISLKEGVRVVQKYFAWGPPIAGQSRCNRGPTDSNHGATLVIAAVSVRFSLSSAGFPPSRNPELT